MVWLPALSDEVLNVAVPAGPSGTGPPRVVAPSLKVTDPSLTGVPPAVTVAVKVTDWPKLDGFGAEPRSVVVAAWLTTWSTVPVVPAESVGPEQGAVMVWLPALSDEVLNVAVPAGPSGTGPPRVVPPSVKVTVPEVSGLPPAVTVAVKVTDWPKVDGFGAEVTSVEVAAWRTTWSTLPELPAKSVVPE